MSPPISVMPTVRDLDFDLPVERIRDWHPFGRHTTYLFSAMSLFFPEGEKFFIQSVRHYRDRIPPGPLGDAVTAFIAQEGAHGREHRAYNRVLEQAGFPVADLEKKVIGTLDFTRKITFPSQRLAVTIALEHFTAILAHNLLTDAHELDQAHPGYAALWRWHAMEETEHKAVAYDVYMATYGGGLRGYLQRCMVMLTTAAHFVYMTWRFHWTLLKKDKLHRDWAGWRAYLRFAFVHPGVFRKIIPAWLAYFRPGFHPWQQDDRHVLAQWQTRFAEGARIAA